jgi:uncharacterized membrane protein
MAIQMMSWLIAIPLLGVATGLRTMTPIAVICWYAYAGALGVDGTWATWTGRLSIAILFTVLAVGELIGDKLPQIPNRISLLPLLARVTFGGMCGSIAATAISGPGIEGVLLGVLGALLGAFGGFMVRRHLRERFECEDWKIAICEDATAIVFAVFAMRVITT